MLDPPVRQRHGAELELAIQQPLERHVLHYVRGKAADGALLHGDQHRVLRGQLLHQLRVQRLAEARVRDGRAHAKLLQLVGRRHGGLHGGAVAKERDVLALAAHHALADLERGALEIGADALRRKVHPNAIAAWVAERRRAIVDRHRGGHHVDELCLVGGRHQHHLGNAAQVGDVKGAAVRGAVRAHHAGAVHGKAHRQLLERHVVHHLVVSALQEGGVDGAHGNEALAGQASSKCHGVLLRDADVKGAVREVLLKAVHARAAAHGCVDADNTAVALGLCNQRVGKVVGVAHRLAVRLALLAAARVKLHDSVHLVAGRLGRHVAAPLLRHHVDHDRADSLGVTHLLEHVDHVAQVVAVDGADVVQAELLKEG
mmetsp:Transcript_7355/g.18621  ORF Transcript_7355/g.18621 Transcript_7355/m.18621 type:complete len:372 (+) Transcript_7355:208-1323(+)